MQIKITLIATLALAVMPSIASVTIYYPRGYPYTTRNGNQCINGATQYCCSNVAQRGSEQHTVLNTVFENDKEFLWGCTRSNDARAAW